MSFNIYKGAKINIHGGPEIPQNNIYLDGMSFMKSIDGESSLSLGAVGGSNFNFKMNNVDIWKTKKMRGELIYVSYDDDSIGAFEITEAKRNIGIINIDAYGISTRLDKTYAFNKTVFPTTLKKVVEDVGKDLNVVIDNKFVNNELVVDIKDKSSHTYRDIISYVAAISGGYGMIDNTNRIVIRNFKQNYSKSKDVQDDIKNIVIGEELMITGVIWYNSEREAIMKGTDDNLLLIPNNPFIESLNNPESFVKYIGDLYIGMKYNPVDIDLFFRADIEPGDVIHGDGFKTIVMSIMGSVGGSININTTGRSTTQYLARENQELI